MIPPIDLREEPCAWRQEDGLQRCRLEMEEPVRCPHQLYECMLPSPPLLSYAFENPTPFDFQPPRRVQLRKQLFNYGPRGENQFWAWTEDGKKPIFPIPMEEEI